MNIAEKIRRLRTENGLTQAEFGRIAGVSDKAVSTWELGKKEPRMKALRNICAHFNIDINQFADTASDVYSETPPLINGDAELTEYLETLKNSPAHRMLFHVTKDATKADIEAIVLAYEAMKRRMDD